MQSTVSSSANFNSTDLCRRILDALPSDFHDVFNEVTNATDKNELIQIARSVYREETCGKRATDQINDDCVRNWTARSNEEDGLESVAKVLDPIFIQESLFNAVRRLASCLDAIGVHPSEAQALKFFDRNIRKHQVVFRLFDLWKTRVLITCVGGFIGRVFPESTEGRMNLFQKHWTRTALEYLETFETRDLASFLCPNESLSPSAAAGRRTLLNLLTSRLEKDHERCRHDCSRIPSPY